MGDRTPILAAQARGVGQQKMVPAQARTYDVMVAFHILLGCWPGHSQTYVILNLAALWILLLFGVVMEFVYAWLNRDLESVYSSLLCAGRVLPTVAFGYHFFGRQHGFEHLVSRAQKSAGGDPVMQKRVCQDFDQSTYFHLAAFVIGCAIVVPLNVVDINDTLLSYKVTPLPGALRRVTLVAVGVREVYLAALFMFLSFSFYIMRLMAIGLEERLNGDAFDITVIFQKHDELERSVKKTLRKLQYCIVLILVLSITQFSISTYEYGVGAPGSSDILTLSRKIIPNMITFFVLLIPPSRLVSALTRVTAMANRVRSLVFVKSDSTFDIRQCCDALVSYLQTSEKMVTFVGVVPSPALALSVCSVSFVILVSVYRSLFLFLFSPS